MWWILWTTLPGRACSVDPPPARPEAWQVLPPDGTDGVATGAVVRALPVGDWEADPVELGGRLRLVGPGGPVEVERTAWTGRVDLAPRTRLRPDTTYVVEELVSTRAGQRVASARYAAADDERWQPLASFTTGRDAAGSPPPTPRIGEVRAWSDDCGGDGARAWFDVDAAGIDPGTLVELEDRHRGVLASIGLAETARPDGRRLAEVLGIAGTSLRVVLRSPTGDRASDWVEVTPERDPGSRRAPVATSWGLQGVPTLDAPSEPSGCRSLTRVDGALDERARIGLGEAKGKPWYVVLEAGSRHPILVEPSRDVETPLELVLGGESWQWEAGFDGREVTLAGFGDDPGLRIVTADRTGAVLDDLTIPTEAEATIGRMSRVGDRSLVTWETEGWDTWAAVVPRGGAPTTIRLERSLGPSMLATDADGWWIAGTRVPEAADDDGLWLAFVSLDGRVGPVEAIPVDVDTRLAGLAVDARGPVLATHARDGATDVFRWIDGAESERARVGHSTVVDAEQLFRVGARRVATWTVEDGARAVVIDDHGRTLPLPLPDARIPARMVGLPDGLFGYGPGGWTRRRCE